MQSFDPESSSITTEAFYEAALARIYELMQTDVEPDTAEGEELEELVRKVQAYESQHVKLTRKPS